MAKKKKQAVRFETNQVRVIRELTQLGYDLGMAAERAVEEYRHLPDDTVSFDEGVKNAYDYLSAKVSYDHLQTDLQCLYYLANREYLGDVESDLINNGIVFETNFEICSLSSLLVNISTILFMFSSVNLLLFVTLTQ